MKIVIVNSPVIRCGHTSPENDPRLESALLKLKLSSPRMYTALDKLGICTDVRYGYRAGCRWPYTISRPDPALQFPISMAYPAAYLKAHGFDVNIIDAIADRNFSYPLFIEQVRNENADIVIIECSTPTIDIDLWMAKEISGFADVALAGSHLTTNAKDVQDNHPHVTYLLPGEYIKSSLSMAQTKQPGIYPSDVVTDMDSIPCPFRDYPAAPTYYDPSMPTSAPQLQIYASKGCPFHCTFCSWTKTMYNGNVTYRKPKAVAAEIRSCLKQHPYKSIFFDDDTFNVGTARVSKLCDELKEIGLPWSFMGRLDTSPRWILDKMVASGCTGMRFGLESLDQKVLDKIQKGLNSEKCIKTLRYLTTRHPDLMIHLMMMRDMPKQTEESHIRDMKILADLGFINHHGHHSYQLSSCSPFPGTVLYEQMKSGLSNNFTDEAYDGGRLE